MIGRPSDFTSAVADAICERLADGESLKSICSSEGMPHRATVFRWLGAHAEFRDSYARAREAQADALFDEILDIANTPITGEKTKVDKDGNVIEMTKADMIDHRRLQIDARKWIAAKLRPKVYGDKLDVDLTGALDFVVSAKLDTAIDSINKVGTQVQVLSSKLEDMQGKPDKSIFRMPVVKP